MGVIIPDRRGHQAFCSGGDQRVRGDSGYLTEPGKAGAVGRFHVTDLHIQMRRLPADHRHGRRLRHRRRARPAPGVRPDHRRDNAKFGQVGPKVGSFDGGFGAGLLAQMIGEEGQGDLVPVRAVLRRRRPAKWAWSTRSCPG